MLVCIALALSMCRARSTPQKKNKENSDVDGLPISDRGRSVIVTSMALGESKCRPLFLAASFFPADRANFGGIAPGGMAAPPARLVTAPASYAASASSP